jgi:hypothetical protein
VEVNGAWTPKLALDHVYLQANGGKGGLQGSQGGVKLVQGGQEHPIIRIRAVKPESLKGLDDWVNGQ